MISQSEPSSPSRSPRARRRRVGWTLRITPTGMALFIILNLAILVGLAFGISWMTKSGKLPWQQIALLASDTPQSSTPSIPASTLTHTRTPTASPTTQPSDTLTPAPITASPQPISTLSLSQGLIILALDEGGNTHLFAYQPEETGAGQPLPITRLTYGPWDDINPAISPDGQTVAFASNRNGYWDIYVLDLNSNGITRLTDTLEYEAAPSWSPDGKWLVYEAYVNQNLEIKIQSLVTLTDTVQLTTDAGSDFSPVWSPAGRQIAFVSNRSGEDEIWLADLDKGDGQRFTDISLNPTGEDILPAWSPDGTALAWIEEQDGMRNLVWQEIVPTGEADATTTPIYKRNLGNGDWPAWSPDGGTILTVLQAPNRAYMTAYRTKYPGLVLPALELPGNIYGLSWGMITLSSSLPTIYQEAAQVTATPLYIPGITETPDNNGGRYELTQLSGIQAPQPYLHDSLEESFLALRNRIAYEAGWDFLSRLDNAYVPLTSPLDPGMGNDWLYTGRAIALDTLPINAGWIAVVREDFGAETYWRVYIRASYQDGSAGMPLHELPWDFNARFGDNTQLYEQGGAPMASIPTGYWIDFTARAQAYGWERLPALTIWRASYPAARFNEFVSTGGLDWQTAMLELYPPEAMVTPSPVVPPTRTPSPTYRWYVSPTPTNTPTPRPTFTPLPVTPTNPAMFGQQLPPTPGG